MDILSITNLETERLLIFLRSKGYSSKTLTASLRQGKNVVDPDAVLKVFSTIQSLDLTQLKEDFKSFDMDSFIAEELELILEQKKKALATMKGLVELQLSLIGKE